MDMDFRILVASSHRPTGRCSTCTVHSPHLIQMALVALTIMALGESWESYLWAAIDSTAPGLPPETYGSPFMGVALCRWRG